MQVISLVPAATELLCAVGGRSMLVGRSSACDRPAGLDGVPVVCRPRDEAAAGGGFALDVDLVRRLRPDVILTQALCGDCAIDRADVERVAADLTPKPAVVALSPGSIEDVFDDVLRVGAAVGRDAAAAAAVVDLRDGYWSAVDYVNPYVEGPRVVVLEWLEPIFVAGHWTPQLVDAAGGRYGLVDAGAPSRSVRPEDLLEVMPDRLVVCPCGCDLDDAARRLDALRAERWWPLVPAVRDGAVALVDGRYGFSRPGPGLVECFRWLVGWLNERPELIAPDFPWRPA